MQKPTYEHPFVTHLIEKVTNDRAARAALRRTLGRAPGEAPEAFRYVVPWLPDPCSEQVEKVYYLVAGLYAYHPSHTQTGNMGAHLRVLAGDNESAIKRMEGRLEAALRAHPDDLPDHLRRLVGILRSKDQPVNWHALMGDLLAWDYEPSYAKKRWAASFWGRSPAAIENGDSSAEQDPLQLTDSEKE